MSPAVCAGPTSTSETGRSPTRRSSRPSNVLEGKVSGTPSKENGAKMRERNSPAGPSDGAARYHGRHRLGRKLSISSAQRREEMISEPDRRELP